MTTTRPPLSTSPDTTIPSPPQMLTWLAHEAGVSEARGASLWASACRQVAAAGIPQGTPEYWKQTMARLHVLLDIESRQLDRASALRRWARLQRKVSTLQMTWMEAGLAVSTRLQRRLQQRCSKLTPCCH